MTLALSSTAIVLQTLNEKNLMSTDAGQTSFAVLLFQDVAVIPMLAIMPLLAVRDTLHEAVGDGHAGSGKQLASWVEGLPPWEQTLVVLLAVGFIVLAGRYLLRPVFRIIAGTRLRELFTAAALLLIIGIALLMSQVGLSPALGTFVAGVVLANSEYRHELESEIDPFKGLLLAVFFIAVGASVDFQLIRSSPQLILGIVGVLMVVKFVILFALGRGFGMGLDQNFLFAFGLAQGGEFAFVLFSFASQNGVIGDDVTAPLIAAVAVSMALTPVLMLLNEKLIQPRFGTREQSDREPDTIDHSADVIIAGFGRFGSIVGRFLRANGVRPTVLEYDSDRVELLRKLGLEVYYGDASRKDLLEAAGAAKARLLVVAMEDHDRALALVETAQKHFPHLTIFARAKGRPEAYELVDLGVEHVYRETLDTSLRTGRDVLHTLGKRAHRAYRAARTFRAHDEASVRELGRMRHDRKAYLSAARERIESLEELLLSEFEAPPGDRDAGWDTESLRSEYGSR
jgi:Kef-type K+ transport system membrane component KefB/voltage-gated potassium channel Kch